MHLVSLILNPDLKTFCTKFITNHDTCCFSLDTWKSFGVVLCCEISSLFLYFSDVDFPHDMCCFSSDSWKSLARLARSLFRSLKASGEENGSLLSENHFPAYFPRFSIVRGIVCQRNCFSLKAPFLQNFQKIYWEDNGSLTLFLLIS